MVFVGKLIASKGVELLLAAWPLVLAREPRARLMVVGFGAFRAGLEELARRSRPAISRRPRDPRRGRARAPAARRVPRAADDGYRAAAAGLSTRRLRGRLDHDELADLLPAAEAMAMTSTFPEAFGMVAAEAAACGRSRWSPTTPGSGGRAHAARGRAARPHAWLSFEVGPDPSAARRRAVGWLAARTDLRAATREAIVEVTRARYSWDGVARGVIAAARGELSGAAGAG